MRDQFWNRKPGAGNKMADDRRDNEAINAIRGLTKEAPSVGRRGRLIVSSSSMTEAELKNIERALLNPPRRADWLTTTMAILPAAFFAVKTYKDASGKLEGANLFAFGIALLIIGGAIVDAIRRSGKTDAHHTAAVEDVRNLIQLQQTADREAADVE